MTVKLHYWKFYTQSFNIVFYVTNKVFKTYTGSIVKVVSFFINNSPIVSSTELCMGWMMGDLAWIILVK